MYALTYRIDTGALSTFVRGIALAALLVSAVVVCAAVAPLLWPLCCTIAAGVTCACNAAVCTVTMAVPFVIMKML